LQQRFGKSARLLKRSDFQFRPFRKYSTELFNFIFTTKGSGRLGVSISKKVLKRANARNRVRRLLREAFRRDRESMAKIDVHVIAKAPLTEKWDELGLKDIIEEFRGFRDHVA
jgi:ribonuclease P protein component